jgi:hypothetical protein
MAAKMKRLAEQMEDEEEYAIERLIIEEPDVEKIALNAALGRLWRTWRKRVRSPISPLSPGRGVRPVSSYSSLHLRKASRDTVETLRSEHEPLPEHRPTETDIAANIPLPLGDNDVNEIEVHVSCTARDIVAMLTADEAASSLRTRCTRSDRSLACSSGYRGASKLQEDRRSI